TRLHPAIVPAVGLLMLDMVQYPVACHDGQQFEELVGLLQVKLTGGRPDKEVGEDRLANGHSIQDPAQPGIGQVQANVALDGWLVVADQLIRCLGIPGPDLQKKGTKRFLFHEGTSLSCSGRGTPGWS